MPNGGGNPLKLKPKVDALQLSVEGLIKLLGSNDPSKRELFWERLKGITSIAEYALVESHLTAANSLVLQAEAGVKAIADSAKQIGGAAKASGTH
jgi:hypothetical protein